MKEFKLQIINTIVERTASDRLISLHEVGTSLGHKHISTQDCRDIMIAVLKKCPTYRAIKMLTSCKADSTTSLWTSLHFAEKGLFEEDQQ